MLICSSPWLFAAYHVFLRLLVPRHPPCALFSLTFPPHSVVASGSWPFGLFFISVTWCFPHLNSYSGLASDVLYLWFYSRFKILFNIRFSRYNRTCVASSLEIIPLRVIISEWFTYSEVTAWLVILEWFTVLWTIRGLKWTRTTDLTLIRRAL